MVYVALNVLDFECVGELYLHLMTFLVKYEYWYISLKSYLKPLANQEIAKEFVTMG